MNKKVIAFALVVIILVTVGFFILPYFDDNEPIDISENTDQFDYTHKPLTVWNESNHEFKFHQKITSKYNQSFENISIDIIFYDNNKLLGIESYNVDDIKNGSFNLDFTVQLDSQPTFFTYNVPYVNWT